MIKTIQVRFLFIALIFVGLNEIRGGREETKGIFATFPSVIYAEYGKSFEQDFCVHFINLDKISSNYPIEITIQNAFKSFETVNETLLASTKYKCFKLKFRKQKPANMNSKTVLEFYVKLGNPKARLFSYHDTKVIHLIFMPNLVFLETDKSFYRPKETVKLRVLSLDGRLRPTKGTIEKIQILDPSKSVIYQAKNLTIEENGLYDFEFPLADEPNFGSWKVELFHSTYLNSLVKWFEVKKYKLPRFKAEIIKKSEREASAEKFEFQVCALYSFGAPLTYDLEYSVNPLPNERFKNQVSLRRDMSFTNSIKGAKKCKKIELNLLVDVLRNNEDLLKKCDFLFNVTLVEQETESAVTHEFKVETVYEEVQKTQFELLSEPYCKPGLPIYVKLKSNLREHRDASFSVNLTRKNELIHNRIVKLNKNGIIEILVDSDKSKKQDDITVTIKREGVPNAISEMFKLTQLISNGLNHTFMQFYENESKDQNQKATRICNRRKMFKLLVAYPKSRHNLNARIIFSLNSALGVFEIGAYDPKKSKYVDIELNDSSESSSPSVLNFNVQPNNKSIDFRIPITNYQLDTNYQLYEFNVSFDLPAGLKNDLKLFAFMIDGNELVIDQINIDLYKEKKCLENVKLSFEQNGKDGNEVRPGSKVEMKIEGQKNARCIVSAIDESLTYLGPQNLLEPVELLNTFDSIKRNISSEIKFDANQNFPSFSYLSDSQKSEPKNPIESLKRSNLLYISNFKLEGQKDPDQSKDISYHGLSDSDSDYEKHGKKFELKDALELIQSTARAYFPESWIWNIEQLDEDGYLSKSLDVPHSITKWLFNVYCLSTQSGIDFAPKTYLKAFQSVFIHADLPISVKKGEKFDVKAIVHSNLTECIPVRVEVVYDQQYFEKTTEIQTACICPEEANSMTVRAFRFPLEVINFNMESPIDIIVRMNSSSDYEAVLCNTNTNDQNKRVYNFFDQETRTLEVLPEGNPVEIIYSEVIDLEDSDQKSIDIEFNLAEFKMVKNTDRVYIQLTSDVSVSSTILNNMDHLIVQPTGCGEQNMVTFVPLVAVLKYLKSTDQLEKNQTRLKKAYHYLSEGFQNQMRFVHGDGLFSVWGKKDKSGGGTWLSALVLNAFADLYELMPAVQSAMLNTFKGLVKMINYDGSFSHKGTSIIYYRRMISGMQDADNLALTAFLVVTLEKAQRVLGLNSFDSSKSISFLTNRLESSRVEKTSSYSLALIYYALASVVKSHNNNKLIESIDKEFDLRAIKNNITEIYWESDNSDCLKQRNCDKLEKSQAANLELTSYVLLAKLKAGRHKYVKKIANWVYSQKNSKGGGYSTQDTIVSTNALAEYAKCFKYFVVANRTGTIDIEVFLNDKKDTNELIGFNEANRNVQRKIKLNNYLKKGVNKLTFTGRGIGIVYIQVVLNFNNATDNAQADDGCDYTDPFENCLELPEPKIMLPKRPRRSDFQNEFKLSVSAKKLLTTSIGDPLNKRRIVTIYVKYNGTASESSQALINVRLPTGISVVDNFKSLLNKNGLREVEENGENLNFYFDRIGKTTKTILEFEVYEQHAIINRKSGAVRVYEYYENIDDVNYVPLKIY